jgi:hypothetical protein
MPLTQGAALAQRKFDFVLLGLGTGTLALGILIASMTGDRRVAADALLGLSMACFAAAVWRSWLRRAGRESTTPALGVKTAAAESAPASAALPTPAKAAPPKSQAQPTAGTPGVAAPSGNGSNGPGPQAADVPDSWAPQKAPTATKPAAATVPSPPGRSASDLQVLLDSSVTDLLLAALLKDPPAARRLRRMLADLPEPADPPRIDGSGVAPGPAT